MQATVSLLVGAMLGLLGIGMPIAFPKTPEWIGYALILVSIAIGLRAGYLWLKGNNWKFLQGADNAEMENMLMSTGPKNVFHIGDSNTVSNVHVGDVNQAPAPQFKTGKWTEKENADGSFTTTIEVEVISPYPASALYLKAWAPTITNFKVRPTRIGTLSLGHTGKRVGYHFTSVEQPFGRYLLEVQTEKKEQIRLEYDLQ